MIDKSEANNGPEPPTSHEENLRVIEAERLEIEEARLELERSRANLEYVKSFYEEWAVNVLENSKAHMAVAHLAVDYGKFAMRSVFLLNGGALIALPTFGTFVDRIAPDTLVMALGSFTGGLVVVTVAMLCGYFSLGCAAKSYQYSAAVQAATLNKKNASGETLEKYQDDLNENERKREKQVRAGELWEYAAIMSGVLSLGAFIFGALKGAQMLTSLPVT